MGEGSFYWTCPSTKGGERCYRVTAKQQSKREQTRPVCLHGVEKCKKVGSINTQNDYETTSKKWTDKKKTDLSFVFLKSV